MDFITFIAALGSVAAIATFVLTAPNAKMPSIKIHSWGFGSDLYLHPCFVLRFKFSTSFHSVEVLSVSLPGYRLRPRDTSFISSTGDPSVVSVNFETGLHGGEKEFAFDCFPVNGQPEPPQISQLSVRMRWHRISWSHKRLLSRPSKIDWAMLTPESDKKQNS